MPRSSKDQVERHAGGFKVKLTAPPVEGKANSALQKFLAKKLEIAKTNIQILSGEKGREKVIRIQGVTEDEVNQRIV